MLLHFLRLLLLFFVVVNNNSCFYSESDSAGSGIPPPNSKGFTIKGISMVAPVKPIDETALKPMKELNANSIAVMPYAFCTPDNPVIRYNHKGQWWGESDEGVIGSTQLAHDQGLSVMLKPHLWIDHGQYTGAFLLKTENEWRVWEDSYLDYATHFARLADSMKIDIFCFATELGAAVKARPHYFSSLIDTLKKVYRGKLTYAANWDDYTEFPFWDKLDYIGVDAYFPLAKEETPSVNSLKKGWQKYIPSLEKISKKHNRPVLFSEYGYRNVDFTGAEPWKENEGKENNQGQSNAYEAIYQSFTGKEWFAGGYVWKWFPEPNRRRKKEIDFTPQEKPALKVIANWYRH